MLGEMFLQNLARWRPADGADTFEAEEGGVRFWLRADLADALACRLWEVKVTRPSWAGEPLADRAGQLARRVTGLLEPLRLVEADGAVAQLRSDAPQVRDDARLYYEVTLSAAGSELVARVQRFEGSVAGARRQAVPFALTHEALVKLLADLAA